jgi:hypothetical protein
MASKIECVTMYKASDGSFHPTRPDAEVHEMRIYLGTLFANSADPYINALSKDQAQAVTLHLARNIKSIIAEFEINELI